MANQPAILGEEQKQLLQYKVPDVGGIRSALQEAGIKNVWEGGGALTQIQEAMGQLSQSLDDIRTLPTTGVGSMNQLQAATKMAQEKRSEIENLLKVLPQDVLGSTVAPTLEAGNAAAREVGSLVGGERRLPTASELATQQAGFTTSTAPSFFDPTRRTTAGGQVIDIATGKVLEQAPSPITPSSLESSKALNIPSGTTDTSSLADSLVVGANTSIAELMKQLTPPETATDKKQQALLDNMTSLTGDLAKKASEQLTTEQSAGLPALRQQFADINAQILSKSAEYKVLQTANQNKPITMNTIIGNDRAILNAKAADIGLLQARALGLQGQIETAQATVDRAIDLKYSTIQAQLSVYKAQLTAIQPELNKQQKQQALAQQLLLTERQNALNDKKAKEKQIQNLAVQAVSAGITDANVIKKIGEAKDFYEALQIYSSNVQKTTTGDYSVVNVNGTDMIFDKDTGTLRPTTITESESYFTDANGVSWNLEGWATDPTKAQQMQSISDTIGKLTDANLEAKVKQYTPGITADMIRNTSAKTGVSWEALMTMVKQESLGGTSYLAKTDNNFGGLTFANQEWIKPYGGTKGSARPTNEGGNYIKFPTKQSGLDAMGALMANYGTVVPETKKVDTEVQSYVSRVNAGALTDAQALKEISSGKKKALIEALATTPKTSDNTSVVEAKGKINEINKLKESSALNDAVGTNFFGRDWSRFDMSKITGDYQEFIGGVSLLTDQLTLDKLVEAKSRGATFGALSERELQMLANAATKIGSWAKTRKDGTVKGYNIDEKSFKRELDNIKMYYQRDVERKGGNNYRTMSDGTVWELNDDGTVTQIN